MKTNSYDNERILKKKDSSGINREILFMIFFIIFLSVMNGICTAENIQKK